VQAKDFWNDSSTERKDLSLRAMCTVLYVGADAALSKGRRSTAQAFSSRPRSLARRTWVGCALAAADERSDIRKRTGTAGQRNSKCGVWQYTCL
jgi:hypothetical protein